jgi:hypothetical protein
VVAAITTPIERQASFSARRPFAPDLNIARPLFEHATPRLLRPLLTA